MSTSPDPVAEINPDATRVRRWLAALVLYIRERLQIEKARRLVADAEYCVNQACTEVQSVKAANEELIRANEALQNDLRALKNQLQFFAIVNPNAKCPACGHSKGTLSTYTVADRQQVVVIHTCDQCKFPWGEPPIAEDAFKYWYPALIEQKAREATKAAAGQAAMP